VHAAPIFQYPRSSIQIRRLRGLAKSQTDTRFQSLGILVILALGHALWEEGFNNVQLGCLCDSPMLVITLGQDHVTKTYIPFFIHFYNISSP
jgi:hypothetical protein